MKQVSVRHMLELLATEMKRGGKRFPRRDILATPPTPPAASPNFKAEL